MSHKWDWNLLKSNVKGLKSNVIKAQLQTPPLIKHALTAIATATKFQKTQKSRSSREMQDNPAVPR